MGEVYLGEDSSLRRSVALKVLHRESFGDEDMMRRFQREAQAAARLSHPNIITTYEIGTSEGVPFIAMEYVEGTSLAQRIQKDELTVREALDFATQLLDGLEHAHRAGIVHRDIKPDNLLVGNDNRLRILDFGLAHMTETSRLTESGATLGTLAYMSPEQARGMKADARSDIFSAGCVLYEMVTRQPPFHGEHRAAILYSIVNETPQPMARYRRDVSAELERIVSRALAKDAAMRYQSAADMRSELAALGVEPGVTPNPADARLRGLVPGSRAPAARRASWLAPVIVGVSAVAVTALAMSWLARSRTERDQPVERFNLGEYELVSRSAPAISADGRMIYFATETGNSRSIVRRPIDSFDAVPVAGTDDGYAPFLSADGTWLGFITPNSIRKVPVEGGASQTIASIQHATSAEWAPDGSVLYTVRGGGENGDCGIGRVTSAGATREIVVPFDSTAIWGYWLPQVLPDGKSFLYSFVEGTGPHVEAVMGDGRRHRLIEGGFCARYVPPGYLMWVEWDSQALFAAPFEPSTAAFTGEAFPVVDALDLDRVYDSSREGTIVFVLSPDRGKNEVVWVNRQGKATPAVEMRTTWKQPRLSPDGRQLVVRKTGVYCELWLADLDRGGLTCITTGGDNHRPVWSPDGKRIAFSTVRGSDVSLVAIDIHGDRSSQVILDHAIGLLPHAWSPDGRTLVCSLGDRTVELVRVDGDDRSRTPWAPDGGDKTSLALSPDGRWIAYETTESGRPEVLMRAMADPRKVYAISTTGGASPLWSHDGREIFFVSENRLWSVSVTATPELHIGFPVELFGGNYTWNRLADYDVAPDGQRFIMIREGSTTESKREIRVVRNWLEEIERLRTHVAGTH